MARTRTDLCDALIAALLAELRAAEQNRVTLTISPGTAGHVYDVIEHLYADFQSHWRAWNDDADVREAFDAYWARVDLMDASDNGE